jgi:hypothetical protein
MFGREARSPIDILESSLADIYHDVKNYGTVLTREIKRSHDVVKQRLLENAKRTLRNWNASHPLQRTTSFAPGDHVLMFRPNLNKQTGFPDHSAKFNKSWHGPYLVREHRFQGDSDVYLLEDTDTKRQWSVNVNKLTRYFPRAFLSSDSSEVPAALAEDHDATGIDRGGADQVDSIEPTVDEVAPQILGGQSPAEALASLETVIPTVQQLATDDLGVTRSTPTLPVSHAVLPTALCSDRTRKSKQELTREVKRSRMAADDACDYAAKLKSYEFNRILNHGKAGNRYYYVVEWTDAAFEPSRVWSKEVETSGAVDDYWRSIPRGSRPRMFRKNPFAAEASTDASTGITKSDGSVADTTRSRSQHRTPTGTQPGTRSGMRPRVPKTSNGASNTN